MNDILICIDNYLKKLEKDILSIVEDQTIPLTKKNQLMEPIADQKKVLTQTKKSLKEIQSKKYEAKCGMSEKLKN